MTSKLEIIKDYSLMNVTYYYNFQKLLKLTTYDTTIYAKYNTSIN